MADMDGVLQVEMLRKSGQVVGVVVHIVALGGLSGAAMATAVMGDHAIAMVQEEQQLRVPIIGRQGPAMAEHNCRARTPVLVEDLDTVLGRDGWHKQAPSFQFSSQPAQYYNQMVWSGVAGPFLAEP